jgi:hypothetical protein
MSEVRLVVRDAGRDWSGTIHRGCADRAIAALGADPVTMEDLEVATERFKKTKPRVWYHDGQCCTNTVLRYHVADDCRFTSDSKYREYLAEARRLKSCPAKTR